MAFEFGEVMFTLSGLIVASYNPIADTYGTPAVVSGGQTLDVEPEADTDQLREYGSIVELLAVIKGAKLKLSAGGYDYSVFAILSGFAETISGTDPNQKRTMKVKTGGSGMKYFGAIGEGEATDGSKVLVGLPKAMLNTFPKAMFNGTENKFSTSETEGYAAGNPSRDVMVLQTWQSGWTRPADGTAFKTFFA